MTKRVEHFATKKAFTSRTPTWAKNAVTVTFVLTSAFTIFIAGTNLFPENIKFELMLGIKSLDVLIAGLAKMVGVTYEKTED